MQLMRPASSFLTRLLHKRERQEDEGGRGMGRSRGCPTSVSLGTRRGAALFWTSSPLWTSGNPTVQPSFVFCFVGGGGYIQFFFPGTKVVCTYLSSGNTLRKNSEYSPMCRFAQNKFCNSFLALCQWKAAGQTSCRHRRNVSLHKCPNRTAVPQVRSFILQHALGNDL